MYIYFEPQSGLVKKEPIRSNFYVVRLPASYLGKVELGIARARLEAEGFVYEPSFIHWIEVVDTRWDQKTGLPP